MRKIWELRDGLRYNQAADARRAAWEDDEGRRQWRRVRAAAVALLKFAHVPHAELGVRGPALLPAIAWYARSVGLLGGASGRIYPSKRDRTRLPPGVAMPRALAQLQAEVRAALARFVLDYGRAGGGLSYVRVPRTVRLRLGWFRHAGDGLTLITEVLPPSAQLPLAVFRVLADALPWLRACRVCGRLFFKVKRQQFCALPCKSLWHNRARRGAPSSERHRGRPRRDVTSPVTAEYTAWLASIAAPTSAPRMRKGGPSCTSLRQ